MRQYALMTNRVRYTIATSSVIVSGSFGISLVMGLWYLFPLLLVFAALFALVGFLLL